MSVRKRTWTNANGPQERWLVDYRDGGGTRRTRQFRTKREATAFSATATVEVRDGVHVPDRATVTVTAAAAMWLASGTADGLERTTIDQRLQHVERHILPFIGTVRLNKLTVPFVRSFQDTLRASGRSSAMVKRVTTSLGGILRDAEQRGLIARNPISELRAKRGKGESRKERIQVGVDVPLPQEISALIAALASPNWRALLVTAIFTGMRASELRGLRWVDVDLQASVVHVRQRADRYNAIGKPKSNAGTRTIPMPKLLCNLLREWKLACPIGDANLVFPNRRGGVMSHTSIIHHGLHPAMLRASLTTAEGKPKYTGLHALRHFYASWCINRKVDGGLELPAKLVQERLGHSSIMMTLDVYGHLFPAADDGEQLAAAAERLAGPFAT